MHECATKKICLCVIVVVYILRQVCLPSRSHHSISETSWYIDFTARYTMVDQIANAVVKVNYRVTQFQNNNRDSSPKKGG